MYFDGILKFIKDNLFTVALCLVMLAVGRRIINPIVNMECCSYDVFLYADPGVSIARDSSSKSNYILLLDLGIVLKI